MQESDLIKELRNGSDSAFEKIFDIYSNRLFWFCLRYTKSRENAEEIVQDTFIKLWNNRTKIKHETTLKSLLYVMARNQMINAYRAQINSPIYEEYLNYCNRTDCSVDDSHHLIEYDDFCNKLNRALDKLPKTQQAVFKHCKLEQMSNKEVAERLSLSEQTVKNQLSLCLKSLKIEIITITALLLMKLGTIFIYCCSSIYIYI